MMLKLVMHGVYSCDLLYHMQPDKGKNGLVAETRGEWFRSTVGDNLSDW